jgi:copper chaperone
MVTKVLKVNGMSCGHCKQAVESALQDLPGVAKAVVDLATGEVVMQLAHAVSEAALAAAIDEAGYECVQ